MESLDFKSLAANTPTKNKAFTVEFDGIDLKPSIGHSYFIGWDRIKDAEDILGWLSHLSEKQWMTSQLCEQFIEKFANRLDIKYRPLKR